MRTRRRGSCQIISSFSQARKAPAFWTNVFPYLSTNTQALWSASDLWRWLNPRTRLWKVPRCQVRRCLAYATAPPRYINDTFLHYLPVLSEIGIQPIYFQLTLELSTIISQSPFPFRIFMSQNCIAIANIIG